MAEVEVPPVRNELNLSQDGTIETQSVTSRAQPKAPNPSLDPGVVPRIEVPTPPDDGVLPEGDFDVMTMDPLAALQILYRSAQGMCDMTGDVPPTPPVARPTTPTFRHAIDELRPRSRTPSRPATPVPSDDLKPSAGFAREQIGEAEAHVSEPHVVDQEPAKSRAQFEAIARKFFSKKPPPVSVQDYLLRLHRYCPMSTAVYLAGGSYIYRLAFQDHAVPVTPRTVHRLLLAALRVAMKALEDLSYPHQRFAGVGGVSERELAKLEISLCYLIDFDLRVTRESLQSRTHDLVQLTAASKRVSTASIDLRLPVRNRRKTIT